MRFGGAGNVVLFAAVERVGWGGGADGRDAVTDTVERVGLDLEDDGEVRCFGLRPTGGGTFFDVELVVEVDKRRSGTAGFDCPAVGLKVEVLSPRPV
jgi:hypothetical protein